MELIELKRKYNEILNGFEVGGGMIERGMEIYKRMAP